MGEGRIAYRALVTKREGRDQVEQLGLDGRITFKWALNKRDGNAWTGLI
jgi:hypothetical protein